MSKPNLFDNILAFNFSSKKIILLFQKCNMSCCIIIDLTVSFKEKTKYLRGMPFKHLFYGCCSVMCPLLPLISQKQGKESSFISWTLKWTILWAGPSLSATPNKSGLSVQCTQILTPSIKCSLLFVHHIWICNPICGYPLLTNHN